MEYQPSNPGLICPCGRTIILQPADLIDDDTSEYKGAIWQTACQACDRNYTVEVANDPDYPED